MKKTDSDVDIGWIVHVYGHNRRLLCALEPSHGWAFLAGLSFGLLLAIAGYNLVHPTQALSSVKFPEMTPETAPLQLD